MKYIPLSILCAIVLGLFYSCKPSKTNNENMLSVTIEPQKYFLEAIVGNKFSVNTAIPSGANPESYDPSPSQMVNISKSKIYFKVGNMGFENSWLNNIGANNPHLKIVDCSVGIAQIIDEGHGHHGADPHIWSSPKGAASISKNMYNALIEYDSKNRDYYLERYKDAEKIIQQTDSIIRYYLDQVPSRSFIIYHPALSYFSNEYSLKQYSIEVDGKSPSPQQLAQLIKEAKKDNVKVIFLQPEFDRKNAETIAKELNAKIVPINPLSYNWSEELINIAKAIAQKE